MPKTRIPLSEVGDEFVLDGRDDYRIGIAPGSALTILFGAKYPSPACRFAHTNVLAKQSRLFEVKRSRKSGRKSWTQHACEAFYFEVPKDQIYLLPTKGYSYVHVEVGGVEFKLNVSGCTTTDGGWRDWVHRGSSAHIDAKVRTLKAVADVSLSPAGYRQLAEQEGVTLNLVDHTDGERKVLQKELARYACLREIAADSRRDRKVFKTVWLEDRYSIGDRRGPFDFECRPPRSRRLLVSYSYYKARVKYRHVDWVRTAEINGIEWNLSRWNRVGGFVEPQH